ncbi:MAG: class I SAM-dependent methyltransferase [Candidatus Sedimenticola sp. (ex Thyasira tokunagai)]
MKQSIEALTKAGVHPYGSEALDLYEERLTRFFTREYSSRQDLKDSPQQNSPATISKQGPMVIETTELMDDHYDRQLPLFRSFLDRQYMAYTMAYYGETPDEILARDITLEQAQQKKFELISNRAGIKGDERIFSIGCGFGPLETYLFENYPNLHITSITPSKVQAEYIRGCTEDPAHPLSGKDFRLIEGDFSDSDLNEREELYDIVFAIGVFEHINNLQLAFQRIASMLVPGGKCFLHLIVSQPEFPEYQDSKNTLIGKYFPGGRIWPFALFENESDCFTLDKSWYVNGLNYWKTLDEWHRRYWANMHRLHREVLSTEEVRHWNDYFTLCKVVLFAPLNGTIYGNGHYLLRKK